MMVDPGSAPSTEYKGNKYYFMSEMHKKAFEANPGRFLSGPPPMKGKM